jgi:hypothetical protein
LWFVAIKALLASSTPVMVRNCEFRIIVKARAVGGEIVNVRVISAIAWLFISPMLPKHWINCLGQLT